jgi:hypothetical protein
VFHYGASGRRAHHSTAGKLYGRGARRDITNDTTLAQIAAAKEMVKKGTHVWRYGHMGKSSRYYYIFLAET